MTGVFIVAARRTAIGSFGGSLGGLTPVDLGIPVISALLEQTGLPANRVDSIICGNVLGAGHGMNIARQIGLGAGLNSQSTAYTLNMVCGSGLQAVRLAVQSIAAGDASVVLAGGVESMSQAGYISLTNRFGSRMGASTLIDTMVQDGLTDAFGSGHMGCTAENIAREYQISRADQDSFAAQSQQKAIESIRAGLFRDEIVPIEIKQKKQTLVFTVDEYPREGVTADSLAALKPAFDANGTVTAGNASGINDGAAFVLLCSKEALSEYGLDPLAEITGSACAGVEPAVMGLGPVQAVPRTLQQAGWSMKDLTAIESNEAFAVQALAVSRTLGFDESLVNTRGGAIALGHPIGASGARILVTLLHRLRSAGGGKGLATLCVGGGQGVALTLVCNS